MRAATVCAAVLTLAATFAVEARTSVRGTSARSAASSRAAAKTSAKASAQDQNPYRRSPYVGALVFDAASGQILFSDRADARAYPASVTKLMTAYLVLDEVKAGRVRLTDVVAASPTATREDVWLRQPSCTGLRTGAQMTVDELLKALMVNSANDAAIFLAERCCGSREAFVAKMNEKARALGMTQTAYYNPNGLPPAPTAKERKFNVSTCNDLAKLARGLLRDHPGILRYTSLKVWKPTCVGKPLTDAKGNQITWVNHNNVMVKNKLKVINPDGSEAADGLKTGYIDAGGSSVILTGTRKGRRAVVIVLGSASAAERDENARRMLTDALDSFSF
ncbi:MAG: D-alanyl-D-alanine carboxypeptidase family protein [Kiritimatiellia bacterium]